MTRITRKEATAICHLNNLPTRTVQYYDGLAGPFVREEPALPMIIPATPTCPRRRIYYVCVDRARDLGHWEIDDLPEVAP